MANSNICAASINWTFLTIDSCGRPSDHISRLSPLDLLPRCLTISAHKNPYDKFTSNHNYRPLRAYCEAYAITIIHNEVSSIYFGDKRTCRCFISMADISPLAEMHLYGKCYQGSVAQTATTQNSSKETQMK